LYIRHSSFGSSFNFCFLERPPKAGFKINGVPFLLENGLNLLLSIEIAACSDGDIHNPSPSTDKG